MEIYKEDLSSPESKEFQNLLNSQLSKSKIEEGKIINGVVSKISEKFVFLFIEGLKSEPVLDINEIKSINLADKIKEGSTIPVLLEKLEDITSPVDIVNVFRPSAEVPAIAKQATKIGAKVLWLQYGIDNLEAQKIAESANMIYISNKCIKQEYQKLFLKISPVFPALRSNN